LCFPYLIKREEIEINVLLNQVYKISGKKMPEISGIQQISIFKTMFELKVAFKIFVFVLDFRVR
jgi:hypothetical protein